MDGTIDGVIRFSARQVTGQKKRSFLALVCKRKLGGVVELVYLDLDGKELTIQFKEGIELIVEQLSKESAC
jgi:hypothetical protein